MNKRFLFGAIFLSVVFFSFPSLAATNPFMDVPNGHWAYDSIAQLAAKGFLSGYPDGTYKGAQPMTRYSAASATARVLAAMDAEKADRQDVEMLKRLVVEFKDELDALGVKVNKVDGRLAVLEEKLGGWSISGSFRMDWKWADLEGGSYTEEGKQDLSMRFDDNWIQLVRRIDEKVTYSALLARRNSSGLYWKENFITVNFPWEITAKFGRTDGIVWEEGLYNDAYGDDAWFLNDNIEGMVFDKQFGMGAFALLWGHYDDPSEEGEQDIYGARMRLDFNEELSMSVNGLVKEFKLGSNAELEKVQSYWIDFGVNFTPDIALRGMYAANKYDWAAANNGLDDSPKAYKAILDIGRDTLKYSSLWIEYAKLDPTFMTHINGLAYAEQIAEDSAASPAFGIDDPTRNNGMNYLLIAAEQEWSERWVTFFRYLDVKYDVSADGMADHTNWMLGVRYLYSPSLQFELLYDKIEFDNAALWTQKDDHMIRLRTSISF